MRKIFVATVGRSDYGLSRPVLDQLAAEPSIEYGLIVTGGHLSARSGQTVTEIEGENRPIVSLIPSRETLGEPHAMAAATGEILAAAADVFEDNKPDLLLVLGDRFEMFAIAAAAVPFNIPTAHIHGGELSYGAIDEVFRHAITKMSHLHFASTAENGARIVRMGEDPWRVTVSGAPGLDNILKQSLPDRATLSARFGIPLSSPPILVTFHPVTRQFGDVTAQIGELLHALSTFSQTTVITAPNADAGSDLIRAALDDFRLGRPNVFLVENLGSANYLAMLRESAILVGNSSSGIVEAPSFHLPTVNIGDRQLGRTRASNVIDVQCERGAIIEAITRGLTADFRASLSGTVNPYGDGHAAERIVNVLRSIPLDFRLTMKRFFEPR